MDPRSPHYCLFLPLFVWWRWDIPLNPPPRKWKQQHKMPFPLTWHDLLRLPLIDSVINEAASGRVNKWRCSVTTNNVGWLIPTPSPHLACRAVRAKRWFLPSPLAKSLVIYGGLQSSPGQSQSTWPVSPTDSLHAHWDAWLGTHYLTR